MPDIFIPEISDKCSHMNCDNIKDGSCYILDYARSLRFPRDKKTRPLTTEEIKETLRKHKGLANCIRREHLMLVLYVMFRFSSYKGGEEDRTPILNDGEDITQKF